MKKIILFASILFLCSCDSKENSIKVGQTWLYITNEKNPFKKKNFYYQRVTAIKGDYVQYIENEKDTFSYSKSVFVIGNELQK